MEAYCNRDKLLGYAKLQKGYTLGELAKQIDTAPSTLSSMLSGRRIIRLTDVQKIVKILNLNQQQIMEIFFSDLEAQNSYETEKKVSSAK